MRTYFMLRGLSLRPGCPPTGASIGRAYQASISSGDIASSPTPRTREWFTSQLSAAAFGMVRWTERIARSISWLRNSNPDISTRFGGQKEPQNCMDDAHSLMQDEWQRALAKDQAKATELFGHSEEEQRRLGYFHTIREICQQPWTWLRTCDRMLDSRDGLNEDLKGIHSLALTGSGSSEYAGECVRFPLQYALGIPTESISGGALLMYGGKALPPGRPGVLVSVARSGDSPESSGAVELLLSTEPQIRHIVVTCNEHGRLARAWHETKNVRVITLPSETLDKSLVMTSSFTNLLLAVRFLGMLERANEYRALCERLGQIASELLRSKFDTLGRIGAADFRRAVFLGSGSRFAASREAALKMLELTAGRVTTVCETYLGFRHGPMSYVHADTLVVCHLSSDRTIRAYEF